jgi:hypothetical protein
MRLVRRVAASPTWSSVTGGFRFLAPFNGSESIFVILKSCIRKSQSQLGESVSIQKSSANQRIGSRWWVLRMNLGCELAGPRGPSS